jgi:hypothetical protein
MKNGVIASLVVLIATLGWVDTVRADEVTDWIETMLRSALIAATSPVNMSRVSALVQSSMFDAVNGIDRRNSPIHVTPAAAYVMLVKLYCTGGLFTTTQQALLDARRDVSLMVISADESSTSIARGIAWGQFVANEIWTWRLTDGFSLALESRDQPHACGGVRGRMTVKVVPPRSGDRTVIAPPCACTISDVMKSPRPTLSNS